MLSSHSKPQTVLLLLLRLLDIPRNERPKDNIMRVKAACSASCAAAAAAPDDDDSEDDDDDRAILYPS